MLDTHHPGGHDEEEGTVHPSQIVDILLPKEDSLGGHDETMQGKDGGQLGHDGDNLRHDGGIGRHEAGYKWDGGGAEGREEPERTACLEELARELGQNIVVRDLLLGTSTGGLGLSLGGLSAETVLLFEGTGHKGLGGQGQALAEGTQRVEDAQRNGLSGHPHDAHAAAHDVRHGQEQRHAAHRGGGDGNDVRQKLPHGALGREAEDVMGLKVVLGKESAGRDGTVGIPSTRW